MFSRVASKSLIAMFSRASSTPSIFSRLRSTPAMSTQPKVDSFRRREIQSTLAKYSADDSTLDSLIKELVISSPHLVHNMASFQQTLSGLAPGIPLKVAKQFSQNHLAQIVASAEDFLSFQMYVGYDNAVALLGNSLKNIFKTTEDLAKIKSCAGKHTRLESILTESFLMDVYKKTEKGSEGHTALCSMFSIPFEDKIKGALSHDARPIKKGP